MHVVCLIHSCFYYAFGQIGIRCKQTGCSWPDYGGFVFSFGPYVFLEGGFLTGEKSSFSGKFNPVVVR